MLAMMLEAIGYEFKTDLKYRIARFLVFDMWLYAFVFYGLAKWGFGG
jgi:hypothetical protein